jgi:hypothetical protein
LDVTRSAFCRRQISRCPRLPADVRRHSFFALFYKEFYVSHLVTIETQVRDPAAIRLACTRLELPEPVHGTIRLFQDEATGWQVRLPMWRYPVVCETDSGRLRYDNFEGRWGDLARLSAFLQRYAVEKTRLEARRAGQTVVEQQLADGSIRLTLSMGAA